MDQQNRKNRRRIRKPEQAELSADRDTASGELIAASNNADEPLPQMQQTHGEMDTEQVAGAGHEANGSGTVGATAESSDEPAKDGEVTAEEAAGEIDQTAEASFGEGLKEASGEELSASDLANAEETAAGEVANEPAKTEETTAAETMDDIAQMSQETIVITEMPVGEGDETAPGEDLGMAGNPVKIEETGAEEAVRQLEDTDDSLPPEPLKVPEKKRWNWEKWIPFIKPSTHASDKLSAAGPVLPVQGKTKRKWSWKKRTLVALLSVLIVFCMVFAGAFLYIRHMMADPFSQLNPTTGTPLPSDASYEDLLRQADQELLNQKGIVNILLIGVDYAEERETWNGKHAYHADVMMVLAINKNTQKLDMISLPRDTYAEIPGVRGIYKLNSSLDCGGGYPQGLSKVVEAAEWMIGGVPISYYYAVTMPVVKDLVNAIGGVDYDIDVEFTMDGRHYKAGLQHMDGQAVLDYIRVRKHLDEDEAGDLNRINRQKKILIAIFKKMQDQNLWTNLPTILSKVSGVQTNANLQTTAALACIAYKLKEEDITMRSMGGKMYTLFWDWRYCFTDQTNRMKILQEVYGSEFNFYKASEYAPYSLESAQRKWGNMMYSSYVANATTLIHYVEGLGVTPTPTGTPTPTHSTSPTPTSESTPTGGTPTPTHTAMPTHTSSPSPTEKPTEEPTAHSSMRLSGSTKATGISSDVYAKLQKVKTQLALVKSLSGSAKNAEALALLKTECMELASLVGHSLQSSGKWTIPCYPQYNAIDVDFR